MKCSSSRWLGCRDSNPNDLIHDLRHCATSPLIAQGLPVKVMADIIGHSQLATTSDLHAHFFAVAQQQAADLMDRILMAEG
jgi:integrase